VEWERQSKGYTKTKRGVIVEIVPAGGYVDKVKYPHLAKKSGMSRDTVSYIVKVDDRNTSTSYYWPLVKNLKRVSRSGRAFLCSTSSHRLL